MQSCNTCGKLKSGKGLNCKSCAMKLVRANEPKEVSARRNNKGSKWTEQGRKNLSEARMGIEPWNKGKKGLQVAWNKGLPADQQPFYGKSHTDDHRMWMSDWNIKRMKDGTHNWNQPWDDYGRDCHWQEYEDGVQMTPEMLEHFRNAMNKE